jgi:hypothetical protein
VYDPDAARRHQVVHITITEEGPPHALNDKEMIEMAAFEESGLLTWELDYSVQETNASKQLAAPLPYT